MDLFGWLRACFSVYSNMFCSMNEGAKATIMVLIGAVIVSACIGLNWSLFLLFVTFIGLPAINPSVRQKIEEEYKNHHNNRQ